MNKIKLAIDDPCHEKWKNMTPTGQGRFCASCQKEVVDFTGMSDSAVFEFFRDRQAGSVCGRFMKDQLQRDIEVTRKRSPWLPFVFKVTLPALLLGSKAMAQGAPVRQLPDTVQTPVPFEKIGKVALNPEMRTVKVTIRNEEGEAIAGARIYSNADLTELVTDDNGQVEMKIPRYLRNVTFFAEAMGYGMLEHPVKLPSHKRAARVSLVLKDKTEWITMGMVAIPEKNTPKKEAVCETGSPLRIYPNPVAAGQKVWIRTDSLEKDSYMLQLLDQAGTVRFQQAVQIGGKNKIVELSMPRLTAGNYLLTLTGATGSRRRSGQIALQ